MKPHSRHAEVELKGGDGAAMLRRFQDFGRALLAVPRKQIDEKLAKHEAQKQKRRKLRHA
jgi:hypothetical protein